MTIQEAIEMALQALKEKAERETNGDKGNE